MLEAGRATRAVRPGHTADSPSERYFDLPREDTSLDDPDAASSGAHGGFLATKEAADLDAYMQVLANPRALPLLLALVGKAMHITEVGARTVEAPPLEQALEEGGYTECESPRSFRLLPRAQTGLLTRECAVQTGHRDAGGRSKGAIEEAPSSSGLAPERLPIGSIGGDYNRVKCFTMLTDVEPEGGALGLVPGSHLWWGSPPEEFQAGAMGALPGHVRVAVPAGALCMFDQRCWHTGLPNTNGQKRESFIFTYAGPLPTAPTVGVPQRKARWPVGSYGGAPTASGLQKNFLEVGKELEALGRLNTDVRKQLFGAELTHPDVDASRLRLSREPMFEHPQSYLEEIQFDV